VASKEKDDSFDYSAAFLPAPEERFVDEGRLGEGGMGVVDQVRDRALGRSIARKKLSAGRADNLEAIGSLLIEARVAGMLEHPNIVPVYDVGIDDDEQPFYTMRIQGDKSLREVLVMLERGNPEAQREYPLQRLLRIFQSVCMGVDYAHCRGVVHRDMKPDNIRLGRFGEVQIADWGLAKVDGLPDFPLRKAVIEAQARGNDDPCIVIGSPNYMSPEQASGFNEDVGPLADIYALGCILYEILTRDVPFDHHDTEILLTQVETEPVVPPSVRAPHRAIPQAMEDLCLRAMAKEPADRIQSARILWSDVENFLNKEWDKEAAALKLVQLIEDGRRYEAAYQRLREARLQATELLESLASAAQRASCERELQRNALDIITVWGEAYEAYTKALALDEGDIRARGHLADIAWSRLVDADECDDFATCHFMWRLLKRYDDGAYDQHVDGEGSLSVESTPPGATVYTQSYIATSLDERDEVGRGIGRTPLKDKALAAGLYLVTVALDAEHAAARPVFILAGESRSFDIDLRDN
jgi:serine/threonine protein kinase